MNREEQLNKRFPLEDGTTYVQSIDNTMCEYSGLPSTQSYDKSNESVNFIKWMHENDTPENAEKYFHYSNEDMFNEYQNELKGAGVGGESIKENFIDSSPISLEASPNSLESPNEGRDIDFMYKWIQEKSGKKNPISQKRKPKTISEWEDEFDIGGNS